MTRDTSLEAYEAVRPSIPNRKQEILDALADLGPSTTNEVFEHLSKTRPGFNWNSHTRFTELCREQRIHELEPRECMVSGRRCIVYALGPGASRKLTPEQAVKQAREKVRRLEKNLSAARAELARLEWNALPGQKDLFGGTSKEHLGG